MSKRLVLAAAALALLAGSLFAPLRAQAPAAPTRRIQVDRNHTQIGFKAATLLFGVPGRFERYTLDLTGDPAKPEGATVNLSIETASVNTAIASRDEHLRNPDFLNAPKFPRITFSSTKVWREGGKLMVMGTLDLHGVRKELVLPFEEASGKNGAGADSWSYTATLPLNRKEFGIGADSVAAKISLKDTVELNLLLVLYAEEAAPAPAPRKAAARKKG